MLTSPVSSRRKADSCSVRVATFTGPVRLIPPRPEISCRFLAAAVTWSMLMSPVPAPVLMRRLPEKLRLPLMAMSPPAATPEASPLPPAVEMLPVRLMFVPLRVTSPPSPPASPRLALEPSARMVPTVTSPPVEVRFTVPAEYPSAPSLDCVPPETVTAPTSSAPVVVTVTLPPAVPVFCVMIELPEALNEVELLVNSATFTFAPSVTTFAELMSTDPTRVVPPTSPLKVTLPVPAANSIP